MAEFLTPVSTTTVKRPKETEPLLKASTGNTREKAEHINVDSPDQVSKILKNQPDLDTVRTVLDYLNTESHKSDGFSLVTPGPVSAQIVDALVVNTIPDYWRTFRETKRYEKELVKCLKNPNGLGAILSRLRPLIADCRQKKQVDKTRDASGHIEDLIEVLEQILGEDGVSSRIWADIQVHAQNPTQKKLMWKEYVAQIASGRILAFVAEGEDVLKERGSSRKASWLANGSQYASWLGRNIAILMKESIGVGESVPTVTELCSKALGLGYFDRIVASIVEFMVNEESTKTLEEFLPHMKAFEQRKYLNAVIAFVSSHYLRSTVESKEDAPLKASPTIAGVARLLHNLIKDNELLRDHIVTVLTRSSIPALDDSLAARRGVIAAIAHDDEKIQDILEKSLKVFGDSFYVAHAPIIQQEALFQTLVLACGYVQRSQPMFMTMMAKSSYHGRGMSNRIGATSPRARFLGMVVGMAISKLVDKPDVQLNFDLEGDQEVESKWYQRLTEVEDKLGNLKDLKKKNEQGVSTQKKSSREGNRPVQTKQTKAAPKTPAATEITGPRIVEILDESSDEDADLLPYSKPDSDPEDDTDDPTEINRNKPTAPVYIRDLLSGLRNQEDYDLHQLALSTAAPLIRRKANFGTEVTDHIEELATVLTGLHDNFELPEFDEQRQQALIAVLLAKPGPMAQWFARSFFTGDYSIAQRIVILTTMGLAARELAGLKDTATDALIPSTPSFPTKTLPPHLHKLYAQAPNDPVTRISANLAREIMSPLASKAADTLSGPDILKVRTFSSRIAVSKRRQTPIPNALSQIVADNFFFPLTGRWWISTRSSSSSSSDNLFTSPHILPAFIQTLALLLHASGRSTLALPQMTREFWELLFSVRGIAGRDKGVLRAVLFAFLMVLEANEMERLATEQGKEVLETLEWVRVVFGGLAGGSEEDEGVRGLAAAVVVRCQEVVERYRRRMVGGLVDY